MAEAPSRAPRAEVLTMPRVVQPVQITVAAATVMRLYGQTRIACGNSLKSIEVGGRWAKKRIGQ